MPTSFDCSHDERLLEEKTASKTTKKLSKPSIARLLASPVARKLEADERAFLRDCLVLNDGAVGLELEKILSAKQLKLIEEGVLAELKAAQWARLAQQKSPVKAIAVWDRDVQLLSDGLKFNNYANFAEASLKVQQAKSLPFCENTKMKRLECASTKQGRGTGHGQGAKAAQAGTCTIEDDGCLDPAGPLAYAWAERDYCALITALFFDGLSEQGLEGKTAALLEAKNLASSSQALMDGETASLETERHRTVLTFLMELSDEDLRLLLALHREDCVKRSAAKALGLTDCVFSKKLQNIADRAPPLLSGPE